MIIFFIIVCDILMIFFGFICDFFIIFCDFYIGSWSFRTRLIRIGHRISSSFSWTNWIIIDSSAMISTISSN